MILCGKWTCLYAPDAALLVEREHMVENRAQVQQNVGQKTKITTGTDIIKLMLGRKNM